MELLLPNPKNSSSLTTLGFLERAATVNTDCPSVVYNSTWSQTYHQCLQVASSLSSTGVERGQVVSVVPPTVPSMYEHQFVVHYPVLFLTFNNINTCLDGHTLSILLRDNESKVVFVDHLLNPLVLETLSLLPRNTKARQLILIDDDVVSMTQTSLTVDFINTYNGIIEEDDTRPKFKWVQPKNDWDLMVLNYTSSTT